MLCSPRDNFYPRATRSTFIITTEYLGLSRASYQVLLAGSGDLPSLPSCISSSLLKQSSLLKESSSLGVVDASDVVDDRDEKLSFSEKHSGLTPSRVGGVWISLSWLG